MAKTPKQYTDLMELSVDNHTYGSILSLLHWDQETYMPSGGITQRSEQISLLSGHLHELKTSHKYGAVLAKLANLKTGKPRVKGLSKAQIAAVREWVKDYNKATKLPAEFVKTFSQTTSEASQVWSAAKKANNFKLFAPFLEKIIGLVRQKTEILGFAEHPYDSLLESYEPCMTTHRVTTIFEKLQKELKSLLHSLQKKRQVDDSFLHFKVGEEKQKEIGALLLSKLPMDMGYTRLDISSHPFSIALHPHDSRITTRLLPDRFMSNISSILHEAGHSFYEMGLPTEHWGTPLAEAVSLSIHESQSRWWECLIGRSLPFWKYFYPLLQEKLPTQLKKVSLDRFYKAINKCESSYIRVEADEVTYCLHVILRFELERDLVKGTLQVADLPAAWNEKMKVTFGITPPTDTLGCLQDIHWSLGDFGYFPTYALGNLFSAQFFSTFSKKHPDWEKRVAEGELDFVRQWLKTNIHRFGRMYNSDELAKKVTGKPLSEAAYCSYLKKKYGEIYRL